MNYEQDYSHTHCWLNKDLPCGIPLEKHIQCCLCDMKVPTQEPMEVEEIKKEIIVAVDKLGRNGTWVGERIDKLIKQAEERVRKEEYEKLLKYRGRIIN